MPSPASIPVNIPADQLDLPVAVRADGEYVSLRDFEPENDRDVLRLNALTAEQRRNLLQRRIESRPEYEIWMLTGGVVDRERAIREIKAGTEVGRVLLEVEQRLVQKLIDLVCGDRGER